jgi:hypothetical protein
MLKHAPTRDHQRTHRVLLSTILASILGVWAPAPAGAAVSTFGSPLSVSATLDTGVNLGYAGTNTQVMPSPEAPNGVYHTYHYGADTALWNVAQAAGDPVAPQTGQALKISLEGCAVPTAGAPAPLTQIHFQDLSPLPGGGAKVNVTSQPFDIPVCGRGGASGATVTTYEPTNLCVAHGDYVAFNDEGGFVEHTYQNGVPYRVLGSVKGSTVDSFIANNGTGNGAVLSSSRTGPMDGFAANKEEELMMQVTLGTGRDATPLCGGGTAGVPPPPPAVSLKQQTDGVNHQRMVAVAIYCSLLPECRGNATLTVGGRRHGHTSFIVPGNATSHIPIRISPQLMKAIRRSRGVTVILTVTSAHKTFTQPISIRIY